MTRFFIEILFTCWNLIKFSKRANFKIWKKICNLLWAVVSLSQFFFFLGWVKKSIDFLAMLVDVVLVCSSNFVPLFLLWEIRWAYHTINWGQAIFAWGMQTWNHSEKWCESSWSECPPETHQVAGPKCQILDCTLGFGKTNPTGWMYVQAFHFLLATEWANPIWSWNSQWTFQ